MPNLRYTARGRPQSLHRFSRREENLGTLLALAIFDLLAIELYLLVKIGKDEITMIQYFSAITLFVTCLRFVL